MWAAPTLAGGRGTLAEAREDRAVCAGRQTSARARNPGRAWRRPGRTNILMLARVLMVTIVIMGQQKGEGEALGAEKQRECAFLTSAVSLTTDFDETTQCEGWVSEPQYGLAPTRRSSATSESTGPATDRR